MSANPNFVSGWVSDPPRVQEVIQARQERGDHVFASTYGANVDSQLPGSYKRARSAGKTAVFLRDYEPIVHGEFLRAFLQHFGTCVSRGMARGVQTSLDVAIALYLRLLRSVQISFAPIYSLARHEVGKDRCGSGDGAILADAATAVHDYGVTTVELFPGTSENDVEKIAVKFAAPGVGTPSSWIEACKGHTAATFCPETLELILDCLTAGYAVPYAHGYVTGSPNENGISDLGSYGPHCRCFTGWFIDLHGQVQLLSSESWGRFPAGSPSDSDQTMPVDQIPRITLRYADGLTKILAPGEVGVNANRFWSQIQSGGEAWAVSAPNFPMGAKV